MKMQVRINSWYMTQAYITNLRECSNHTTSSATSTLHPPPHMSQLKRQFYQSDENPVTTLVVAESRK
ncbi:unnamed protein product [Prunus armeniaca]|uniref:Uncharacterized protein n=1 Tax=Prunus armeniaca TaxID=36596 RepID=A0A6J5XLH0_PRUAR|nr:unnamed protein product [Prunus armeniaca]